jgi:hypothetical protein
MSNVAILDKRASCRICGTRWHVTTVANARSPRLGLCASCGVAATNLLDWYQHHTDIGLDRLVKAVRDSQALNQPETRTIESAG